MNIPPCFRDEEAKKVIEAVCKEHSIDVTLLKDLCEVVQDYSGSGRAHGIIEDVAGCIDRFIIKSDRFINSDWSMRQE